MRPNTRDTIETFMKFSIHNLFNFRFESSSFASMNIFALLRSSPFMTAQNTAKRLLLEQLTSHYRLVWNLTKAKKQQQHSTNSTGYNKALKIWNVLHTENRGAKDASVCQWDWCLSLPLTSPSHSEMYGKRNGVKREWTNTIVGIFENLASCKNEETTKEKETHTRLG